MYTMGEIARIQNPMDTGARFKALRKALGLTQEELARAAKPSWGHTYAAGVERGTNAIRSHDARGAWARAFWLEAADFDAYLAGEIGVPEAVKRSQRPAAGPRKLAAVPPPPPAPPGPPEPPTVTPAGAVAILDSALGAAFDSDRHTIADVLAVREALVAAPPELFPAAGLVAAAGRLLDAAATLRSRGVAPSTMTLLLLVAAG